MSMSDRGKASADTIENEKTGVHVKKNGEDANVGPRQLGRSRE